MRSRPLSAETHDSSVERTDLYSWADRLAWGEDRRRRRAHRIGSRRPGCSRRLADGRRPIQARQSGRARRPVMATCCSRATAPPAIVDVTPYWRPPGWAAGGDRGRCPRLGWRADRTRSPMWDRWPDWRQLLRRALLFRLAVSLAHPLTPPSHLVTMLSTADLDRPTPGLTTSCAPSRNWLSCIVFSTRRVATRLGRRSPGQPQSSSSSPTSSVIRSRSLQTECSQSRSSQRPFRAARARRGQCCSNSSGRTPGGHDRDHQLCKRLFRGSASRQRSTAICASAPSPCR